MSDTREIHGKYRGNYIFGRYSLITEIDGAAFTLNSETGAERFELSDGKIIAVSDSVE